MGKFCTPDAIVNFDNVEKLYIITYTGKGWGIISDANLIEAERKFIDAMNLAEAVEKTLSFIINE